MSQMRTSVYHGNMNLSLEDCGGTSWFMMMAFNHANHSRLSFPISICATSGVCLPTSHSSFSTQLPGVVSTSIIYNSSLLRSFRDHLRQIANQGKVSVRSRSLRERLLTCEKWNGSDFRKCEMRFQLIPWNDKYLFDISSPTTRTPCLLEHEIRSTSTTENLWIIFPGRSL